MEYVERIEENMTIIIYGCSLQGKKKYEQIKRHYSNRIYFTDTWCSSMEYCGYPALKTEDFYKLDRDYTYIFVFNDDKEKLVDKKEKCKLAGFTEIHGCFPGFESKYGEIEQKIKFYELKETMKQLFLFFYEGQNRPRFFRWHDRRLIFENLDKINATYEILEDDESKKILLSILQYRITGNNEYLSPIYSETHYFIDDLIKLTDNEVFIDAGMAQGDTFLEFKRKVSGKYRKCYGFEANVDYCEGLKHLLKDEKIEIIPKGVFDSEGTLYFHNNGHGSKVSMTEESSKKILVTSIDSCIEDEVTFIKMDIEGSELPALKGGKNIIQKYAPKLAVCVYHLEDDLWNIPLYIKELVPEYKIFFRHHYKVMDEETVMYAAVLQ